jgi:hypothetical protein
LGLTFICLQYKVLFAKIIKYMNVKLTTSYVNRSIPRGYVWLHCHTRSHFLNRTIWLDDLSAGKIGVIKK